MFFFENSRRCKPSERRQSERAKRRAAMRDVYGEGEWA